MKRRLFKLVVFVLLGAIVNVAVAWGCFVYAMHPRSSVGLTRLYDAHERGVTLIETKAGLPYRSISIPPSVTHRWTRLVSDWRLQRAVPWGFAINTVFYAVILWMLFAAPFALRRRSRIGRGLCPACAYPVGDSPVCTECGKPVRSVL